MKRFCIELVTVLSLVAVLIGVDLVRQAPAYGLQHRGIASTSKEEITTSVLSHARESLSDCYDELSGPSAELTKAIAAVEFGSVGITESFLERVLLQAAASMGVAPPDLSYGVMQIRPSTARSIKLGELNEASLAHQLLDECENLALGREIVDQIAGVSKVTHRGEFAELREILRAYNGQLEVNQVNFFYLLLVNDVYQRLKVENRAKH